MGRMTFGGDVGGEELAELTSSGVGGVRGTFGIGSAFGIKEGEMTVLLLNLIVGIGSMTLFVE